MSDSNAATGAGLEEGSRAEEFVQGGPLMGITMGSSGIRRKAPVGNCSTRNWPGLAGIPGLDIEDLSQARENGVIVSYDVTPDDMLELVIPTGGKGCSQQVLVREPEGARLVAASFTSWCASSGEKCTIEAMMAWPRWKRKHPDLLSQLRALRLRIDPQNAWVDQSRVLVRAQVDPESTDESSSSAEKAHGGRVLWVLIAPGPDGQLQLQAVGNWSNHFVPKGFETLGDARTRLMRGGLNLPKAPLAMLERVAETARAAGLSAESDSVLSPEARSWVATTEALFTSGTVLQRMNALLDLSRKSAELGVPRLPASVSFKGLHNALDAEIGRASLAGQPAAAAGWALLRDRLRGAPNPKSRSKEQLASLVGNGELRQAWTLLLPVVVALLPRLEFQGLDQKEMDGILRNIKQSYASFAMNQEFPVEIRKGIEEPPGGELLTLTVSKLQEGIAVQTEREQATRINKDIPNPESEEWKLKKQTWEAELAQARKAMKDNEDFYDPPVYTDVITKAEFDARGQMVRVLETERRMTSPGRHDDLMWRRGVKAREDEAWTVHALNQLGPAPPERIHIDTTCKVEYQVFSGSVTLDWTLGQQGTTLASGHEQKEIRERFVRVSGCEVSGRKPEDRWKDPVNYKKKQRSDAVGAMARKVAAAYRESIVTRATARAEASPPEEAAWIRWFFNIPAKDTDSLHVPFNFLSRDQGSWRALIHP